MSEPTKQLSPLGEFQQVISGRESAIASRLPAHMNGKAARMVKIAVMAASKNPAILECTRESVLTSIMTAAELGLEPGGALGEGYLVPYSVKGVKTCQFIPGYRGLISLARRSGQIVSIEAHVVREGDVFDFSLGLEPVLIHKPDMDAKEPGALKAVYGVAKLAGGGVQYEVMLKSEVDAVRKRSKAGEFGPWVSDYSEMARKTVIRRLFKYLPVSVDMARAMEISDEDTNLDASLEVMPEAQAIADGNARAEAAAKERGAE